LPSLTDYCKQNNLFLIHDCAQAVFGSFKNKPIASYGDFSVMSFFADKPITTGEGGLLLTDNSALIDECNIYKHDGRRERGVDVIEKKGYNFRITELQTAVGVAQLNKADYFIKRKKEIYSQYEEKLSNIPEVRFFKFNPDADVVPHRYIIFVDNQQELMTHLSSKGVGVRTTFMPMHSMPSYNVQKDFPVTEKLFRTGICLPSAPTLTHENIEFICSSIREFYEK